MSIDKKTAPELILRAGRELKRTGLIARTWGNISARISDTSFLITPSGRSYESLTPEDLVEIRLDDLSHKGNLKPSSEMKVHAVCYRNRPDTDFVIHTHQDYATDLSTLGQDLSFPGQALSLIPTADYAIFGSDALAENVDRALKRCDCHVVLMRNHGTVCLGKDYEDAFRLARQLEDECKKEYLKKISPVRPEEICGNLELGKFTEELSAASGCFLLTRAPYISKYAGFGEDLTVYVDDLGMMVGPVVPCLPKDAFERGFQKDLEKKVLPDPIRAFLTGKASVEVLSAGSSKKSSKSGENLQDNTSENLQGSDISALPVISNALLLPGIGAVCYGRDRSEAEAMVMVLDKGCQVGLLERAGFQPHAADLATRIEEHEIYVRKYAGLK
jgi:ribulose-5-phosphate 4-epimerase/fuculose-1-phosphate aldolase